MIESTSLRGKVPVLLSAMLEEFVKQTSTLRATINALAQTSYIYISVIGKKGALPASNIHNLTNFPIELRDLKGLSKVASGDIEKYLNPQISPITVLATFYATKPLIKEY